MLLLIFSWSFIRLTHRESRRGRKYSSWLNNSRDRFGREQAPTTSSSFWFHLRLRRTWRKSTLSSISTCWRWLDGPKECEFVVTFIVDKCLLKFEFYIYVWYRLRFNLNIDIPLFIGTIPLKNAQNLITKRDDNKNEVQEGMTNLTAAKTPFYNLYPNLRKDF